MMQYKSSQTLPTCHIFDLSEANWKDGITDFEVHASDIHCTVFLVIFADSNL